MADGRVCAVAGGKQRVEDFEGAHSVLGRNRIGQFIERALFRGEHHGFDIAERNFFLFAGVENQFFQFVRHHHHVAAQSIHQFAGAVGVDLDFARGTVLANPADGLPLLHARQFDNAAENQGRGHGEHFAHAGSAARAFITNHHNIAGFDLALVDGGKRGFFAIENTRGAAEEFSCCSRRP